MKLFLFALLVALPVFAQFKDESELAHIKTGGNSEVQTVNTKTTNWYTWDLNKTTFGGHYIYGESKDGVSARNWDVNAKYERELSKKTSVVGGEVVEGNRFIDIKARYNSDIGFRYYYVKEDPQYLLSELSYRYTIEDRYSPKGGTLYDNKGRFYNEYWRKYSETVSYKIWLEYVPNFTDNSDYLVNGEASLMSILNSVFSLKVAYLGMYDNKPAKSGFKNYDYATTTSLVVKF
jgi:putative salt-induced outer membrane protein